MSVPLKDFRMGISESIYAALEARAAAQSRDMQTVAREVLQDWADAEAHAYRVYARRVIANGSQTELPGFEPEDAGRSRSGRK
jgi:plasmid stability protein